MLAIVASTHFLMSGLVLKGNNYYTSQKENFPYLHSSMRIVEKRMSGFMPEPLRCS